MVQVLWPRPGVSGDSKGISLCSQSQTAGCRCLERGSFVHKEVKYLKRFGGGRGTGVHCAGQQYGQEKHHRLKGPFSPLMKSTFGQFFINTPSVSLCPRALSGRCSRTLFSQYVW